MGARPGMHQAPCVPACMHVRGVAPRQSACPGMLYAAWLDAHAPLAPRSAAPQPLGSPMQAMPHARSSHLDNVGEGRDLEQVCRRAVTGIHRDGRHAPVGGKRGIDVWHLAHGGHAAGVGVGVRADACRWKLEACWRESACCPSSLVLRHACLRLKPRAATWWDLPVAATAVAAARAAKTTQKRRCRMRALQFQWHLRAAVSLTRGPGARPQARPASASSRRPRARGWRRPSRSPEFSKIIWRSKVA